MVDRVSVVYAVSVVFLLFHSTFQQQSPPLRSRTERFALIQLRSSLGLRSREWPIKADPCSNWVGVQCRNGRVIGINVSGFRRTRKGSQNPQFSVDALANFTLLESFNASKLFLPGPIPDWFGLRLGALQVLDLRSCSISGVIPTSLGNLTTLTGLYLSGNGLTGIVPPSLGQLSGLSVLDLSHNSFTGSIPSTFVSLVNLTSLDMSSNYFSGTINPAIGTLSELQFLNLSNNSLASTIPPQLGDLSNLIDLDLSSNAFTGSVPADLRGLRNLQNLVLGNNLLSGSLPVNLFPTLTRLQTVSLNQNNISGNLPVSLWSLPALRLLDASRNSLEGTLPDISLNASTLPAVLNISQNMFYGNLTSVIKRFSLIDLSGNYFEGMVPDYARSNVSLGNNCLRVISSQRSDEECKSFYAKRNLPFDGNPNATQPPPPSKSTKKDHKWWIILVGAVGGALLAVIVIVAVLLIIRSCKRSETSQRGTGVGPVPSGENPPPPPGLSLNFSSLGEVFTYQQLLLATDNFNDVNLIKHGHSGDLFQGILEGGVPVVIKKVDLQTIKKESYLLELDVFSKVSHARLVPLLGHCLESEKENEKFLVYKYMSNGDLSSSLYRKTNSEDDSLQSLDWITRLKIAIGAAEGLSYLHHECTPPLVHRDVQASSILLDDKFEVRLGSLSEVCAQEGDAQQSMITRLLRLPPSEQGTSGSATATCAYDVYCFGKVLLELVTGKLGISASNESKTKEVLEATLPYISIYDKELVTNILDPSLIIDEDLLEEVWAMAVVARSCLNPKPSRRPLMRYVLKALENPLKVVREENTSSARLRETSSRGSWNAALFGSWRSSSDVAAVKGEGTSSFKQFGTSASQGSGGHNGGSGGGGGGGFDRSSSTRRQSKEIFPEPSEERNVERSPED